MIQPTATMKFEAALGLSEAEIRVLNTIASYGASNVADKLREITTDFNRQTLVDLLNRLRPETGACIRRFNAARKAFEDKPEPQPIAS